MPYYPPLEVIPRLREDYSRLLFTFARLGLHQPGFLYYIAVFFLVQIGFRRDKSCDYMDEYSDKPAVAFGHIVTAVILLALFCVVTIPICHFLLRVRQPVNHDARVYQIPQPTEYISVPPAIPNQTAALNTIYISPPDDTIETDTVGNGVDVQIVTKMGNTIIIDQGSKQRVINVRNDESDFGDNVYIEQSQGRMSIRIGKPAQ